MPADVLVAALSGSSPAAVVSPAMPPKTADPHADILGAFVASDGDFALILSKEILGQTVTDLADPGASPGRSPAEEAVDVLCGIADTRGGGLVVEEHRVQLPGVGAAAAASDRAVASPDLGSPWVVVTDDGQALHLRAWVSHGVVWPPGEAVAV